MQKSKREAIEESADSYVKQIEVAVATERLNGNVLDGEYQITSDGNLCRDKSKICSDDDKIKIEMNGTKPTSGKIKITNGTVDQSSSNMTIGDYDVTYNSTKKTYEAAEKGSMPLCTAKTIASTGNVPSGNYAYGDEYSCELGDNESKTFFILEINGDNVSLIMDRNIDSNGKGITSGNTVAWSSDGDNHKDEDASAQAVTAKEYLKNSTTGWTKLTESQISLPSASQIATASGKTFNNSSISGLSTWLYGNLNNSSAPFGYWTSTPNASGSTDAWYVFRDGRLLSSNVSIDYGLGVRPVITISKAQLR